MARILFVILAALPLMAGMAHADQPALVVDYIPVTRADEVVQLSLTGTIEAQETVNAGFRAGGRITDVLVREGEQVLRGQPLAHIDPLQQKQSLHAAEAALNAAESQQTVTRQAAERAEAMLARGIGTRAAHDRATEALASATTAVEQALTRVEVARRALNDTTITAPFDGVITARHADPGQIASPAQAVVTIASLDTLRAVFQTPDDPRLLEAMGAMVALHPIDSPTVTMQARVNEVAPLIGPQTGSVEVHAAIIDPTGDAGRLGVPVRGTVEFSTGMGIWLPWTTLMRKQDGPAVWVVNDDNRASLRPVVVQRYDTGGYFVSDGVTPGEVVIGAGSQLVYPGRLVRPSPQTRDKGGRT